MDIPGSKNELFFVWEMSIVAYPRHGSSVQNSPTCRQQLALLPKNTLTNFEQSFTCPSPRLGPPGWTSTFRWSTFHSNALQLTMEFQPLTILVTTVLWPKPTLNLHLGFFQSTCSYVLEWILLFRKRFSPFGLCCAPFIFNQLSDAIVWILLNNCLISFVFHILDDFLVIDISFLLAPHTCPCRASLPKMILTFRNLNVSISVANCYSVLAAVEVRLPEDKVERLKTASKTFHSKPSTTLQELQFLVGTLTSNFACEVIKRGRLFL